MGGGGRVGGSYYHFTYLIGFPVDQLIKNLPAMWEPWVQSLCLNPGFNPWVRSLGWEDPLEKGKATHSSSLA